LTGWIAVDWECRLIVEQFLEQQIQTGIQNNAITWRDVARRQKNDVKGKHGATSRHRSCVIHCFVMQRNSGLNSGGLDTLHSMQIASNSGPDKYFEVFYHEIPYFWLTCGEPMR
jgi:hypothetical protein